MLFGIRNDPLLLKHLCQVDPSLVRFIFYIGCVWLVLSLPYLIGVSELNANSVDPDQTPHLAASDLGPHCLPMSLLWNAKLIWVDKTK